MDTETSREGDTVDLIAWRRRGQTAEVTEQILELNPGLAELGPILPAGINVKLPDTPVKTKIKNVKRLWS